MFREMRRFRQQLPEPEAEEILMRGKTGILGLIGENGYPYTVPVNYVYAEGRIWFHSAKNGHKINAIKSCNKVSFCVVDADDVDCSRLTALYRSVILFGRARILQSEEDVFRAMKLFGRNFSDDHQAVEREIRREWDALLCIEIEIEHMTGKQSIEFVTNR